MELKRENRGVRIAAHVVFIFLTVMCLAPFLLLISSSVSSVRSIASHGYSFIPYEFDFSAYTYLFQAWNIIGKAYLMTILVTVIGTVASVLVTTMLAFGLSWRKTPGKSVVMLLLIISMLFNGGAVSSYIIWTNIFSIQDSLFALILPNLFMSAFSVIMYMNYFKNSISLELMDAAEIDGGNMFQIYFRIYLPLAVPIIGVLGLTTVLAYWNDWNNGLYYISDQNLYTIQLVLRNMQESAKWIASNPDSNIDASTLPGANVQMAVAVLGILPIAVAYPFFQKYFVAGIAIGGVKE